MEKAKIFVVDDDMMNLKIAQLMLNKDYEVFCLSSGEKLLELLQEKLPDLILLDVHMPEMNGFDIIRMLKGDERVKDIPVIFLTADNDKEMEVKCFKEGALDYIVKPFVKDVMLQRVGRVIALNNRSEQ